MNKRIKIKKESFYIPFREHLVDIFGTLVPGILFLNFTIFTLAWPIWAILAEFDDKRLMTYEIAKRIIKFTKFFKSEIGIVLIIISYAFGRIFFRLNKDKVDEDSYRYIARKKLLNKETLENWVVRKKGEVSENWIVRKIKEISEYWVIRSTKNESPICDYPYYYLYEYLESKGMSHLTKFVPWRGEDEETYKYRATHRINAIKIRLMYYEPYSFTYIFRNEAHIRMMSSIWYVMTYILRLGLILIIISIILLLYFPIDPSYLVTRRIIPILTSFIMLVLAFIIKRAIKKIYHFMRVREIVLILEGAYIASIENPDFLKGLN
ncbi:hypothetical protein [Psychrilyobacter atlanticus]|uniref:hypothetical protein n=1 Tax=Psychrilyobacter atlanticus TaxID=271091 RepID=UPI000423C70B|nr:hypothetical protein [Psychrilyobacter atlanticus]